jgi:PAS domain-containing protein
VHGRWTQAPSWPPRFTIPCPRSGEWSSIRLEGDAGASFLGWTAEELRGILTRDLLHPDDRDALDETPVDIRVPARPVQLRFLARGGRYWTTGWFLTTTADTCDMLHGVDYIGPADAGLPVGTWRWHVDRDVVSWSAELLDMFGLRVGPPASLQDFLANVHDDDRTDVAAQLRLAATRHSTVGYAFRCPAGGGRDRCFYGSGRSYVEPDGGRVVAGLVKFLNAPADTAHSPVIGSG